jgi:hypothetical protein
MEDNINESPHENSCACCLLNYKINDSIWGCNDCILYKNGIGCLCDNSLYDKAHEAKKNKEFIENANIFISAMKRMKV